jgi:hypothetical protein
VKLTTKPTAIADTCRCQLPARDCVSCAHKHLINMTVLQRRDCYNLITNEEAKACRNQENLLLHPGTKYIEISKSQSRDQIQATAYFYVSFKLRMTFIFLES